MDTSAGARLGPYEIVCPLGAGGMGEVFRARDTRLDRSVAVKVLPAELAQNPQFRLRFEREAKTISQLNHPNICTLFDVGDGYIVMELLEGESLADRLARGPLPLAEVLKIGSQIADALDRAHRAGIVHRDLKPGNAMLTKGGAKLLDFGLAKGVSTEPAAPYSGATQQKPLTQEGTIVGTFQYMAPEQLEGVEADPRSDIFALGAVLYEMTTGRRAFTGATRTSLIAAIVTAQPTPIAQIQPLTPPALEHIILKCLAKDPDDRWQSAHDIAEELRWIGTAGSQAGVAAPLTRRRKRMEWAGWAAAALIAAAAAAFFFLRPAPVRPRIETAVVPPDGVAFSYIAGSIALSSDGQQLAFIARPAHGRRSVWIRPLSGSAARPLPGTDDAQFPFWSPDGKYVAFVANGKLKKIGVAGGAPETIAELATFAGGSWTPSGDILVSTGEAIERIPPAGGKPVVVTRVKNRQLSAPSALPDGRHFLFTSFRAAEQEGVFVGSLDGSQERLILPNVYSNTLYVAPGFILYSREGDLRVQRFDPKKLAVSGDPVRLADHVQYDADTKSALFTASQNGTLIYVEGEGAGKSQLVWVGRDGKDLGSPGTLGTPAMYYSPDLSRDGTRVAYDLSDPETAKGDIWVTDIARGTSTRITFDPVNESSPRWSTDDQRLFFFSEKSGNLDIYEKAVSGSSPEEPVLVDKETKFPLDVSSDGRWLLYQRRAASDTGRRNGDLWALDLQKRTSVPIATTPFPETAGRFSPDGQWVAYSSTESGEQQVYVQHFPDGNGKVVVSRTGGTMPAWRPDGKELYYISADRMLMAVPVTSSPHFDGGTPVLLFEARVRQLGFAAQYAPSRDGSKFLLNRDVGEEGTKPMTIVQNWAAAIER